MPPLLAGLANMAGTGMMFAGAAQGVGQLPETAGAGARALDMLLGTDLSNRRAGMKARRMSAQELALMQWLGLAQDEEESRAMRGALKSSAWLGGDHDSEVEKMRLFGRVQQHEQQLGQMAQMQHHGDTLADVIHRMEAQTELL